MEVAPGNLCGPLVRWIVALAVSLGVCSVAIAAPAGEWREEPPLPLPRSEVASAVWRGSIVVVGGFLPDGRSSVRVDAYDPGARRWSRLPSLPFGVNHAMAASDGRRLYVVGGYAGRLGAGEPVSAAFVLAGTRWLALPSLPASRAAGGAAVVGGELYVVGGVFSPGRLARDAFVYDPDRRRWRTVPGPTPREHLGVAALEGKVYAAGGRSAGFDTNLALVEELRPGGEWRAVAPLPSPRGGTGLAAGRGRLVSIGSEAPSGTDAAVFTLAPGGAEWRRLADLPTARHGLAVEAVGGRVYAIGGGPEPGLSVSGANESLPLP